MRALRCSTCVGDGASLGRGLTAAPGRPNPSKVPLRCPQHLARQNTMVTTPETGISHRVIVQRRKALLGLCGQLLGRHGGLLLQRLKVTTGFSTAPLLRQPLRFVQKDSVQAACCSGCHLARHGLLTACEGWRMYLQPLPHTARPALPRTSSFSSQPLPPLQHPGACHICWNCSKPTRSRQHQTSE